MSKRLFDLWRGFCYGLGIGVFALLLGWLTGKIVIYGYSIAILSEEKIILLDTLY